MVTALLLSGGTGSRLPSEIPKQYIEVAGKPILMYCAEVLDRQPKIDGILIVAAPQWQPAIAGWIRSSGCRKFIGFAEAGPSRQHSIHSGLRAMKLRGAGDEDVVIVQDAVRPCVDGAILRDLIEALDDFDGAMPALPVKETVYQSADGRVISGLLDRDSLYLGQAPEAYRFGKYLAAFERLGDAELYALRGSSEVAHIGGLKVRLIPGSEGNYKITTPADLERFRSQTERREGDSQ